VWINDEATPVAHEDRRGGVDVVVQIDLGRVFLQVKRSQRRVGAWLDNHADDARPIGVVVAKETEPVEVVYGRVLGVLILLREQLEAEAAAEQTPMDEAG
jgi:hypothetical protein